MADAHQQTLEAHTPTKLYITKIWLWRVVLLRNAEVPIKLSCTIHIKLKNHLRKRLRIRKRIDGYSLGRSSRGSRLRGWPRHSCLQWR
jgi:hypothetical protein